MEHHWQKTIQYIKTLGVVLVTFQKIFTRELYIVFKNSLPLLLNYKQVMKKPVMLLNDEKL